MTIDVKDLPGRLHDLVEAVRSGEEMLLRDGETTAALTIPLPVRIPGEPRIANLHPGNAWMADDFNDPLPDEFWDGGPNDPLSDEFRNNSVLP